MFLPTVTVTVTVTVIPVYPVCPQGRAEKTSKYPYSLPSLLHVWLQWLGMKVTMELNLNGHDQ